MSTIAAITGLRTSRPPLESSRTEDGLSCLANASSPAEVRAGTERPACPGQHHGADVVVAVALGIMPPDHRHAARERIQMFRPFQMNDRNVVGDLKAMSW
jgi:hypothetical protein